MIYGVLGAGELSEAGHGSSAVDLYSLLVPVTLVVVVVLGGPLVRQIMHLLVLRPLNALFLVLLLLFAVLLLLAAGSKAAAFGRAGSGGSVLLLVLDATVLEPDLDLLLGQTEVRGYLDATETRQVHVGRELALELQELGARESRTDSLRAVGYDRAVWRSRRWRR